MITSGHGPSRRRAQSRAHVGRGARSLRPARRRRRRRLGRAGGGAMLQARPSGAARGGPRLGRVTLVPLRGPA